MDEDPILTLTIGCLHAPPGCPSPTSHSPNCLYPGLPLGPNGCTATPLGQYTCEHQSVSFNMNLSKEREAAESILAIARAFTAASHPHG